MEAFDGLQRGRVVEFGSRRMSGLADALDVHPVAVIHRKKPGVDAGLKYLVPGGEILRHRRTVPLVSLHVGTLVPPRHCRVVGDGQVQKLAERVYARPSPVVLVTRLTGHSSA